MMFKQMAQIKVKRRCGIGESLHPAVHKNEYMATNALQSAQLTKDFPRFQESLSKGRIDGKKYIPMSSADAFSECFVPGFMVKSSIRKIGMRCTM